MADQPQNDPTAATATSQSEFTSATAQKNLAKPRWTTVHIEKIKQVGLHEWLMVVATAAMAIATGLYTQQLDVMRSQIELTQRPWIGVEDAYVSEVTTESPTITISLHTFSLFRRFESSTIR